MAAKSSTLGELHELFAQYWHDQMNRQEEIRDDDGCVIGTRKIPLSAAEAAVLRAFLKDNNVQADPDSDGDVRDLANNLRAATKGSVTDAELEGILDTFQNSIPGMSVLQ